MKQPATKTVRRFVLSSAFAGALFSLPLVADAELGDQPLKKGMRNGDVKELQRRLKEQGFFRYPETTGYFGPITEKAVLALQEAYGLPETGVAGEQVFAALGVRMASSAETAVHLLKIGARGEAVVKLQRELSRLGFYKGNIDGIFGPLTARAVRSFQQANGLLVDGIVGPQTSAVLYRLDAVEKRQKPQTAPRREVHTFLLTIGDRGEAVERLQNALQRRGYYTYSVDGIFGPLTASAVRRFQKDFGLQVDGIAGPQTLTTLYEESSVSEEDGPPGEQQQSNEELRTTILKFRDKGEAVVQLQVMLKAAGFFSESPTGYYGLSTEVAVREFQKDRGLLVDGIAGPVTLSELKHVTQSGHEGGSEKLEPIELIADASRFLGTPYLWGGETPVGFDCSGFVQYVFGLNGIELPRTTTTQWKYGEPADHLKVGDVVFFETYREGPSHNGIYIGNGKFIQSGSSTGVTISELDNPYWAQRYIGFRRFL